MLTVIAGLSFMMKTVAAEPATLTSRCNALNPIMLDGTQRMCVTNGKTKFACVTDP